MSLAKKPRSFFASGMDGGRKGPCTKLCQSPLARMTKSTRETESMKKNGKKVEGAGH